MLVRPRHRIVRDFVRARATTPAAAIPYAADPADAAQFARLTRHGALVEAAPGRWWLCPIRLARFRHAARRRVATLVAGSGLAATALSTAAALMLAE